MILDINGIKTEAKLQKNDLLVFKPERKTISIFRGNHRVIFPGDVYETSFLGDEDLFAYFVNLLSYLIGSDPSLLEIEPDKLSPGVIDEEKCIIYYV